MTQTATDPTLQLHSGQREVFDSRAQFRVVVSGRRWGKTELDKAEASVEFGTPGLVWYIAPTFDMARELMWEPMRAWVPRAWLAREPNETRMEMETIWGCRFACKSAENPDRLRGRGPRKIIADEFQDWKDGAQTWEEVLLPSLLTTNGRALFTGTPKSFNHLHALYALGQAGAPGWRSWQFRTADARHIKRQLGFLEQMRAQMDPRSYRQEFEASFETMGGRVYYAFDRLALVRQVPFKPTGPVCIASDYNVHFNSCVIGWREGQHIRVWREVQTTHAGGEATRATALGARALLEQAGYRGLVRLYGDSTGKNTKTTGPSDHAVWREVFPNHTWCIPRAQPHPRDRIAAVNGRCETAVGDRWLTLDPTCIKTVADLEQVVFASNGDIDKTTNAALTHLSDALGYWLVSDFPPAPRTAAGVDSLGW